MNVLVYSGPGTTTEAVKHCLESLKRHLLPHYAVISVSAAILTKEPWESKTALLVFPGGADLPFCREFNGAGNTRIKKWVRAGGRYAGFCAGGYYGAGRCEFEVGNPQMEVSGSRELAFFPGTCRGTAFPGFMYGSEVGARVVSLRVNQSAFADPLAPEALNYYNGGGFFVEANTYPTVEVLANYTEISEGLGRGLEEAAVVLCTVGEGRALLTGPHPEFTPDLLGSPGLTGYSSMVEHLATDQTRSPFLAACLRKLGLTVNATAAGVPRLTPLVLSTIKPAVQVKLLHELDIPPDGLLVGTNDTFSFQAPGAFIPTETAVEDPDTAVKVVHVYRDAPPGLETTPHFNLEAYYAQLRRCWGARAVGHFGSTLVYGEVVTSTSTLLDKNTNLLAHLPSGLTVTATTQISGRGRGGNVWVNPPGVLAASTVLRLPLNAVRTAPLVFIQYICSLAMVEAVTGYGLGYKEMPVRLKWPNDVYVMKPVALADGEPYVKISGTMVNVNVVGSDYMIVAGTGINVSNAAPTTSLNAVVVALNATRAARNEPPLDPYTRERLLALYMYRLETMFDAFVRDGFLQFLPLYYQRWLHEGQIVHLTEHNTRARVTGISPDWGMLVAEQVDAAGKSTGVRYELQPDGNSFDMFRGLISKKC